MAAKVTVTRNFKSLVEIALVTAEDMRELGLLQRERIIKRTISGTDAEGRAFAPYSAAYAELKQRVLGTSRVDLQVSGNMLNQMTITDVTDHTVTLGWVQ
jgi:hypothetical protein